MTRMQTRSRTGSRPARLLAALLTALWLACPTATASINFATAFTDLWWNTAESGWGVNISHQNQTMFLTFYIYRADGSPYWVSALLSYVPGNPNGPYVFTGDLYENPRGPWFGGAFTPLPVPRKAGTATFTSTDGYNAALTYSVDGVPVTKNIQRFTMQNLEYAGLYDGVYDLVTDSCTPSSLNGQKIRFQGTMTITQTGTALKIVAQGSATCTFNGTYAQNGLVGATTGNYSCTDGSAGPFTLEYIQRTLFGLTGQLSGQNQQCSFDGVLGAVSVD